MNILIISNCPLDPSQGSGYVICGFADGFRARGHTVHAFCPQNFIILPKIEFAKRLRLFIGYTCKAITEVWLKKNRYDIIELWGGVGWFSCLLLCMFKFRHYKVISRSNGLEPFCRQIVDSDLRKISLRNMLNIFNSWTDSLGFSLADSLTVVSKYDEIFAIKKHYQISPKLVLLENALTNDWLDQPLNMRKSFTICFVGSWLARKGCNHLINIINLLPIIGSQCNWLIAGVGSEGKRQLLNDTHLSSTSIYSYIARDELKSLYQYSTVFLSLSSYESFGMACSEALSSGCILVSTNVGFSSGLEDGKQYIRISRNDTLDIANKLFEIERDPSLYAPIMLAGYNKVQSLRWDQNIKKLENIYHKLSIKS